MSPPWAMTSVPGLWAAAGCIASHLPFLLSPNATIAFIALAPAVFCLGLPFGAAPAAIQEIVPPRMRGQASAVYLFVISLLGLAAGPTAVALATDYLFRSEALVRYSLVLVAVVGLVPAAGLLYGALRPYREMVAQVASRGVG